MIPIDQRIRCNNCGNFQRFFAHRSPEDDVISKCLLVQEQGRLYTVKGSVERKQAPVLIEFYQKPHVIALSCPECKSGDQLNRQFIMIEQIEKEYWRLKDEGSTSTADQE